MTAIEFLNERGYDEFWEVLGDIPSLKELEELLTTWANIKESELLEQIATGKSIRL